MKNTLLLVFAFLLVLTGCKKDDENDPKVTSARLQGKWAIVSEKYEYYNAANTKIYEESDANNSTITFTGSNIEATSNGFTVNGTYTINETNGKEYLVTNLLGTSQTVEVTSLTDNNMTLLSETPNDTYYEGGQQKTAAKSIATIQLQKLP